VSEAYEKIVETCMPRGEFKRRSWFFADTPLTQEIVALFEIYNEVLILTVFSNIGEDVQYPLFQLSV
jgi:hypothetical protein